ncbi:hypothetical protein HYPP_02383 [Hyphomicrobium sp. ghe19]|nr:hypothetical protein HYPP_02383 [Hyphomicrobium sp. ghe19]
MGEPDFHLDFHRDFHRKINGLRGRWKWKWGDFHRDFHHVFPPSTTNYSHFSGFEMDSAITSRGMGSRKYLH